MKMTYFELGNKYANKDNDFNAIIAFKKSLSKNYEISSVLNLGVSYKNVGLEKMALLQYNLAIKNRQNNKTKSHLPPYEYTNRADIYRELGKFELMMEDINLAFSYKQNISQAYRILAKYEMMKGNFNVCIEFLTKIIENDPSNLDGWKDRAIAHKLIKNFDCAIQDYIVLKEKVQNPIPIIYQLGKCYFEKGNLEMANKYYDEFLLTGNFKTPYEKPEYKYGIVQHIDIERGFGYIFAPTWFALFDSVYFNLEQINTQVNVGDRVRFEMKYGIFKREFKPAAINVEFYDKISEVNLKKHLIFHGIIHWSQNSFRAYKNLKYLLAFFPDRFYYPIQLLNIEKKILNRAERDGFCYVEFQLEIDSSDIPTFSNFKFIEEENFYSYKLKDRVTRIKSNLSDNYWNCDTCGGDSNTGCQYFDQTECPKFT